MRQIIERGVFRGGEIGPVQSPRHQVLTAVPQHLEKGIVGFWNTVELTGNDAGDSRFRRDRTNARATTAQLLIPFVSLTEVPHHSCKALQFSGFISQSHRNRISPKARTVPPHVPAFSAEMAFGSGPIQFMRRRCYGILVAGIEKRFVFASDLISAVAVNTRCSCIPIDDMSVGAQQEQRIVLYP